MGEWTGRIGIHPPRPKEQSNDHGKSSPPKRSRIKHPHKEAPKAIVGISKTEEDKRPISKQQCHCTARSNSE
jgi:hypothetical protein